MKPKEILDCGGLGGLGRPGKSGNPRLWGSGRPRAAGKPLEKVGSEALETPKSSIVGWRVKATTASICELCFCVRRVDLLCFCVNSESSCFVFLLMLLLPPINLTCRVLAII